MIEFEIEELLNHQFIEQIDEECSDYIMNLSGDELDNYFEVFVDYARPDGIEDIVLSDYKSENIQGQNEITGVASVYMGAEGYSHFSGEDIYICTETIKLNVEFMFYMVGKKAEEFSVLNITRV